MMFDCYEDIIIPYLRNIINHRLPKSKIKASDYFQQLAGGDLGVFEIGSEGFVEDLDFRRNAYVLLQGIQYMRETRRQVQLLSEFYGE